MAVIIDNADSIATFTVTPDYRRPIMRRDTNNVLVRLGRDDVLRLMHELTRDFDGDTVRGVFLMIEGGTVYPQQVFE